MTKYLFLNFYHFQYLTLHLQKYHFNKDYSHETILNCEYLKVNYNQLYYFKQKNHNLFLKYPKLKLLLIYLILILNHFILHLNLLKQKFNP